MTTIFLDTFSGTGAITSHVPDITPDGLIVWNDIAPGSPATVSGGYALLDGSTGVPEIDYNQGSPVPYPILPAWNGATVEGLALEFSYTFSSQSVSSGVSPAAQIAIQCSDIAGVGALMGINVLFTSGIDTRGQSFSISYTDGHATDTPAYTFNPGETHTFRFELRGDVLTFFLDAVQKLQHTSVFLRDSVTACDQFYLTYQDGRGTPAGTGLSSLSVEVLPDTTVVSVFWQNFVDSHEVP